MICWLNRSINAFFPFYSMQHTINNFSHFYFMITHYNAMNHDNLYFFVGKLVGSRNLLPKSIFSWTVDWYVSKIQNYPRGVYCGPWTELKWMWLSIEGASIIFIYNTYLVEVCTPMDPETGCVLPLTLFIGSALWF